MPDAYPKADEVATSYSKDAEPQGRLLMKRRMWTASNDPVVMLCNGWSRRAHHVVGGTDVDASTRLMAASVARRYMTLATHDLCDQKTPGVFYDAWGNAAAIQHVGETVAWAKTQGAKAGKVSLIGISMGATAALNYALSLGSAARSQIGGIALVSPVLDTTDIINRDIYLRDSIFYNFGGSEWSFMDTGQEYNPMNRRGDIEDLEIPINIWYSSNDPIAYTGVTEEFINTTDFVKGTVVGAYGHSIDNFPMDDIASWLERRTVI